MAMLHPGAEEEYDRLHAAVWPEVLAALTRAGIRNYSIFRHGRRLFSYFELSERLDPAAIHRILLADPACARWEEQITPLRDPRPEGPADAFWEPMDEVFHNP